MEATIFQYNPWWESKYNPAFFQRKSLQDTLTAHLKSKPVVLLTGLRRSGKTTLMRLLIKHLIDKKMSAPSRILYVSLDHYLLSKYSILEIVNQFRKIQNLKQSDFVYLFLDEVTAKEDFEIQLKNLYDSGSAKVFASSSSASMLRNKKNYLTGRSLLFEVQPLDFEEYLEFRKLSISRADTHLKEKYFDDFLLKGGIPEYVLTGEPEYLTGLVDDIIYKDIAALHGIKNIGVLKDFFLLLMERAGKQTSINKLARILQISPDTSRRYFDLFVDSYLIHAIPRNGKTNERLLSSKKIYAADNGIRNLFTGFRDKGSLFENYVFLKIKHLKPRYIYENKLEIDFITEEKHLIEAKYHDLELEGKQKQLFESIKAKSKSVFRSDADILNFLHPKMK